MHPEAMQAIEAMIVAADLVPGSMKNRVGLDVGGQQVNGSARPLFGEMLAWYSLDLHDPTATYVADARIWQGTEANQDRVGDYVGRFDIVLCSEVLEHVRWWPLVVRTCFENAVPGGHIFITAAAPPRHPHSAQGLPEKPADEWYENIDPDELRALIDDVFKPQRVEHAWRENPGDVYLWAQK